MYLQKNSRLCKYFYQGRCKFGDNCRFSHQIIQCYLIRHAQSEFNSVAEQSQYQMYSEQAKYQYQLNPKLIDCRITQKGKKQIEQMIFSKQLYSHGKIKVDVIFVSPLKRALYTALHMIRAHKIQCKQIIVLPNLTEVLSKVCDFCHPLQQKFSKFPNFSFQQFKIFQKQKLKQWQDNFVLQEFRKEIDKQKHYGQRYLKILQNYFPTPLQPSNQCFQRTIKVVGQIKSICLKKKFTSCFVVSHNRILKYISSLQNYGKGSSFKNCEIRQKFI